MDGVENHTPRRRDRPAKTADGLVPLWSRHS